MKVLIIGLGSIARKHIDALNHLRQDITYFALRSQSNAKSEPNVQNIYSLSEVDTDLDFCIISNPTHLHFNAINEAIDLNIPLFIEKPSLMSLDGSDQLLQKIKDQEILTHVAFNLRFHPVINYLKNQLDSLTPLEVTIYGGSYLPDWRPNVDYRKVYSSIKKMGGGVHLDLIHEIDYATWLFGFPEITTSVKKKLSQLEINSIDYAHYHMHYPDKMVSISLNYFRRQPKRTIELVTNSEIIYADLFAQKIWNEKGELLFESNSTILDTYQKQMEYFLSLLATGKPSFSTFENSLENLKICLN